MFRKIRITILTLILAYVSLGAYKDTHHNWDRETVVVLHPINASGDQVTQQYIDGLKEQDFDIIARFVRENGQKYRGKETRFKVLLGDQVYRHPKLPTEEIANSIHKTMLWSLQFRFFGLRNMQAIDWGADTVVYLNYYNPAKVKAELTRSSALERGRIAVVNLYAHEDRSEYSKGVVLHEMLHTFGAEDRYDPFMGSPLFPQGYADPQQKPLYPQLKAEVMGGYIPLNEVDFVVVESIDQFVMNEITARDLGWIKNKPKPEHKVKFES